MTIHYAQLILTTCLHRNVLVIHTGGMHFSGGEVWDDIEEQIKKIGRCVL